MKISVNTFSKGTIEDSAHKVLEEGAELIEAYYRWVYLYDSSCDSEDECLEFESKTNLMLELGDVLTATMNLCEKLGFEAQECVDMVETKNILRGYYDTIE